MSPTTNKWLTIAGVVIAVVALLLAGYVYLTPIVMEQPVERAASQPIVWTNDAFTIGSGANLVVASGGGLQVTPGATVSIAGASLSGAPSIAATSVAAGSITSNVLTATSVAAGDFTGNVLNYEAVDGDVVFCASNTITGTLAITSSTHGIATGVDYAVCSLGADPTGDAQTCSTTVSGTTVTVKVWQSAATPAANTAGVSVDWCAIGTP